MSTPKRAFTTAPLPFVGQKRRFVKEFKQALEACPPDGTYIDLFGGSGLLSHQVEKLYPDATVIYNDYDGYSDRIRNIPNTNKLLQDIRKILAGRPRLQRITGDVRAAVLERVKAEMHDVDYVTLSTSLLFSMKYVQCYEELEREVLYNRIKKDDYNADGYLDGLTIVCQDYREIFEEHKADSRVIYLVDPPYLSTDCSTYKNYWKLADYLNVLDVLDCNPYFYFTSNKSSIIELCEWIETRSALANPFKDAERREVQVQMNHSATYTDIMLYKTWETTTT